MKLEIKNLSTNALKSLDLEISKPGIYGIIGRNGVGKSTFFTAISDELKYSGEITVKDSLFSGRVSYVPSLSIFDENLKAQDYIKELKGIELENALKYMPKFYTDRFFTKPIKKYSLGMKEILAFIYTISIEADVLIIDELMNGLDHNMRNKAYEILKDLSQTRIILLTSHILEEMEKNCNQVYFLSKNGFSEVTNFENAKQLILETEVFL
ncbi:ATP-binding cassette domain-containing protein [Lactococcus lactis]|uniref:ATP-binding cassette domain-containing protein n=1 Tax=Lactococcus lactis TaxID=1358 RepID=UPI0022B930EB|nr:AAA family ATPase [Lactococcus lactis]MCZ8491957.1 ATP-binding cassette domain-containing protein [Lactococcus lactis]